jgi:hypothetical protein
MENILELPDPDNINCVLYSYLKGHKELYIEAYVHNEIKYIFIDGVEYYSGPVTWKGANFRLGSEEECITLLESSTNYKDFTIKNLNEVFSLFKINTTFGTEVKILGNKDSLFLVKNLPEHLR